MGVNVFNYCKQCGHHIDRHVHISIHKGAPCTAPLGNGHTCTCKGFVSPDAPKPVEKKAAAPDEEAVEEESTDDVEATA